MRGQKVKLSRHWEASSQPFMGNCKLAGSGAGPRNICLARMQIHRSFSRSKWMDCGFRRYDERGNLTLGMTVFTRGGCHPERF